MADEITPALTRSEWEDCETQQPVVSLETTTGGALSVSSADAVVRVPDEYRHALAALALYRQPFGFRREDVRLLEHAAERTYSEDFGGSDSLSDLARRVAALLPPEHG